MWLRAHSKRALVGLCAMLLAFTAMIVAAPLASAAPITQDAPFANAAADAAGSTFSDQLATTGQNVDGTESFSVTGTLPAGVTVSPSGQVNSDGSAPVGVYGLTGNDVDADGDSGTWAYTLTVSAEGGAITQDAPFANAAADAAGSTFSDQLATTGQNVDGTESFSVTGTLPAGVTVSPSGQVNSDGSAPVGVYGLTGNDVDADGDSGTWAYTLTVSAEGGAITQDAPFANAAADAAGSTFSDQLATTGQNVDGTESFSVTGTLPAGVTVSPSGQVNSDGSAPVGVYGLTGNDVDADGDSGTWAYTLTVSAEGGAITQDAPFANAAADAAGSTFSDQLATTGQNVDGTESFSVTGTLPAGVTVSPSGQVNSDGSAPVGVYGLTGNDVDADGDSGTWAYTLTVSAEGGAITQDAPFANAAADAAGSTFSDQLATTGQNVDGTESFSVTGTLPAGVTVSPSGQVNSDGSAPVGVYGLTGNDVDADGDTGTWTYTLTVTGVVNTVSFNAHGGTGTMATESHVVPGALTINSFTRTGYTFVDWNTTTNGSGASYANGATYSFSTSITLYAQWKPGKAPTHAVAFNANGGAGSMAVERDNTPTVLSANHFTRVGYTFTNWNTKANGSGANFGDGATYSFKASVTLYAQWKKEIVKVPAFTVNFNAHGGRGSMSAQRHAKPEALTRNSFTRFGYSFVNWNTAANRSGASYANRATYSFASSTT